LRSFMASVWLSSGWFCPSSAIGRQEQLGDAILGPAVIRDGRLMLHLQTPNGQRRPNLLRE
jgi:hypothetical protein